MVKICTSPYPIEKVGDSPYQVNVGIPRQNNYGFGQYPRGRVYFPSLVMNITLRGFSSWTNDYAHFFYFLNSTCCSNWACFKMQSIFAATQGNKSCPVLEKSKCWHWACGPILLLHHTCITCSSIAIT